jgi:cobalt/nickel transport system permease protein
MADVLDPYRPGASVAHRADARVKLTLAVAGILATAILPVGAWPALILVYAGILSLALMAELGIAFTARRALIAVPFALAALPLIFTTAGTPLASFQVGPWALTATWPGLERFLSIAVKSWLSVQFAILLTATTRFTDLLAAMRAMRVPRLLVVIWGLMWRYLFILVHEAKSLMTAREARSADAGAKTGSTLLWRAKVTGGMAGNLFVRGYERSERVYQAMLARGYDGEVRHFRPAPLPRQQKAALLAGTLMLVAVAFAGILFW